MVLEVLEFKGGGNRLSVLLNITNAKVYNVCMYIPFFVKTAQPISMNFGTEVNGTLETAIGYRTGREGQRSRGQQLLFYTLKLKFASDHHSQSKLLESILNLVIGTLCKRC